jgi:hypothetical protein
MNPTAIAVVVEEVGGTAKGRDEFGIIKRLQSSAIDGKKLKAAKNLMSGLLQACGKIHYVRR